MKKQKKRMKQEKNRRMFERYQTIYLHLRGMRVKQIMEITRRTEPTVRSYIKCYQRNGLAGLQMKFSPGAPQQLTKEQQVQFKQTIITIMSPLVKTRK